MTSISISASENDDIATTIYSTVIATPSQRRILICYFSRLSLIPMIHFLPFTLGTLLTLYDRSSRLSSDFRGLEYRILRVPFVYLPRDFPKKSAPTTYAKAVSGGLSASSPISSILVCFVFHSGARHGKGMSSGAVQMVGVGGPSHHDMTSQGSSPWFLFSFCMVNIGGIILRKTGRQRRIPRSGGRLDFCPLFPTYSGLDLFCGHSRWPTNFNCI